MMRAKLGQHIRLLRRHPAITVLAIAGIVEMGIGTRAGHSALMAFGFMGVLSAIAIGVNLKNPPWPFRRFT